MNIRFFVMIGFLAGVLLMPAGIARPGQSGADSAPLTILVMLKKKTHPFIQYLDDRYQVKMHFAIPEPGKGIPGVEAVDRCDVVLLSQRRQDTTAEQTAILKKALLKDRKPIVGIRQASHAFNAWPEIDREVFGATYKGHFFEDKANQVVQFEAKGKDHPLLAGFKPFMCGGYPYTYTNLAPDVEVLMTGGLPNKMQPIVWTRVTKEGQRIFYTRYDEEDLEKNEDCRVVLARALFWAANRDIEKARKK
jgi:type 1 glutamine amidotransferase